MHMLFIISMMFECFYSIIRPHKAASFNMVKRPKKSIACIIVFCLLYESPQIYVGTNHCRRSITKSSTFVQIYYWFSFTLKFLIPFISLLAMNSVIIHTLCRRLQSNLTRSSNQDQDQDQTQGQAEGQSPKMQSSDRPIYITLLVVTLAFLIFITPGHLMTLYALVVDYKKSLELFAGYYFLNHLGSKLYYTNNGINFYLYVISGKKFRSDFTRLFICKKNSLNGRSTSSVYIISSILTS